MQERDEIQRIHAGFEQSNPFIANQPVALLQRFEHTRQCVAIAIRPIPDACVTPGNHLELASFELVAGLRPTYLPGARPGNRAGRQVHQVGNGHLQALAYGGDDGKRFRNVVDSHKLGEHGDRPAALFGVSDDAVAANL